jgi:hypothetical protein
LPGKTKPQNLDHLKQWIESRGQVVPAGPKQMALEQAREFAGNLPDRMQHVDSSVAQEVIQRAEAAARELSKAAFEAFAQLLRIPVHGTKTQMLKQVKDFVTRLAVIQRQTQF